MNREEVLKLWQAQPFRPFRIITVADEPIDVMHPRFMIVGGNMITIGTPHPNEPPPSAGDLVWLEFDDISRVEPLTPVAHQ